MSALGPTIACGDERRRLKVRHEGLHGIDDVDVSDDQRTLTVTFLGKAPELTAANVRIEGGRRVTGIKVRGVRLCLEDDPELDDCVQVTVDRPGDFSTYTLRLVGVEGLDPRYAQVDFTFKVNYPSDLDCAAPARCPPPTPAEPAISYLAKDYASFRQLILDRLALVLPAWTERHVPDLELTLVELLAFAGDYLSYYQDAVATEAYLDSARRRVSVRRHVRLIDYLVHDGCNARAWVRVEVHEPVTLPAGRYFLATGRGAGPAAVAAEELRHVPPDAYEVFEPLASGDLQLIPAHNEISLWTWGDRECCLPSGATRATLKDDGEALRLRRGDALVLEERVGPHSDASADADPGHRQVVRLTSVTPAVDRLYDQPILEVEWAQEDALTFPLCLSTVAGEDCHLVERVSVARGNVLLVDHGRTLTRCGDPAERLPVPPAEERSGGCDGAGEPRDPVVAEHRFDPRLARQPVTQRAPFPPPSLVAAGQASRLAPIPGQAHARMEELWQLARGGQVLSPEELGEVRTVFGDQALAEARLVLPARRPRYPQQQGAADQARALGRLLALEHGLLAAKVRWLESLARRARAGLSLGPAEVEEVRAAWGDRYVEDLEAISLAFWGPAAGALRQDPREALPEVGLHQVEPDDDDLGAEWTPRHDLLASGAQDRHFVAEVDDEGVAQLRFGDGELGRAPTPGSVLEASYRIGNGGAGNVGAEAINRIVFCDPVPAGVVKVANPLPAMGGTEPEPLTEVKLYAPATFRHELRRAVTADDYATLAGRLPGLQRAAASLRWTGSWYEAQVAVDPLGGEDPDDALLERVREGIHRYRRVGHDLAVQAAGYVPLDLALEVCVLPHFLAAHVRAALLERFRAYFDPDSLTFGDDVAMSRLVAAAQAVPGVETAVVTKLQRLGEGDAGELARGVLALGDLEIARLDNDPGAPENGRLVLDLGGGR